MIRHFLFILIASGFIIVRASAAVPAEGPVWQWFGNCPHGKQAHLQILLDGKPVFQTDFPACHMPRSEIKLEPKQRVLAFVLPQSGNARLSAPAGERVEGNVWEAGSDPDDILLGMSFAGPHQIWLNTLYIVKMGGPFELELEKGLVAKSTITDMP